VGALQQPDPQMWARAWRPGVRTLILSGLYGLVLPLEPIQEYTCHINDRIIGEGRNLVQYWDVILSRIILEIVDSLNIRKVVDLLSEEVYQEAIDWTSIYPRVTCYHRCFRKEAGPSILVSLGRYFREEIVFSEGKPFNFTHNKFFQKPYFKDPEEAILFEPKIKATHMEVAREGVESVLPSLIARYGDTWNHLDDVTRQCIANAEYCHEKFRDLREFDFAHASIGLSKAIEHCLNQRLVVHLRMSSSWERAIRSISK